MKGENSMIGNISNKEGTHLQGFIELERISTKDNIKEVYKNTITNGGKQFLLSKSAAAMLNMSADIFGNAVCSNLIVKNGSSANSPISGRQARSDRDITFTFLNLPEEVLAGMGANTSFINIWNNDMTEADKVVGFANNNIITPAEGKEGIIDYCKGEYMVDPFTVCKRWKFSESQAVGQFNCIAMIPASVLKDNTGDGVKFSKCIDKVNTQYLNYVSMSTGFLIPGIPGYTANNEVLLDFVKDGISKWKYNIGTGEITQVADTDNFFIPTPIDNYTITDMQYIDNYLYVVEVLINNNNAKGPKVVVYDPSNNMAQVASFDCKGLTRYEYEIKASIFKVGNDIYVSALGNTSSLSNSGGAKLWKLNKGSGGYATGSSTGKTDFTSIGLTLPAGMELGITGLGAYGSNYVLYRSVKLYNNISDSKALITPNMTGYKMVGYVFTDLANPVSSMIDMIPGICPNEVLFSTGGTSGTIRVGFDKFNTFEDRYGDVYDLEQAKQIVMNSNSPTNTETVTTSTMAAGVYLTLDKWWTNIISFVKLNTPINKTTADIIYGSYGYKIV